MLANKQILLSTGWQLLSVVLLLSATALLAYGLNRIEFQVSRRLSHHYGWRSVLVTGWLGTSIHELSHLVLCKIFMLRVVDYKLYKPDTRTGTLGYVYFVQDKKGLFGALSRFFVGTSPLFFGLTLLTIGLFGVGWRPPLMRFSSTHTTPWPLFIAYLEGFSRGLFSLVRGGYVTNFKFWIWSYLCLAVGLHMSPSRADIKNTAWGILIVFFLVGITFLTWQMLSRGESSQIFRWILTVGVPVGVAASWTLILGAAYLGAVKLITWLLP